MTMPASGERTYWNGELCRARRVRVIVGDPPRKTWWFAHLVGTNRKAVEITYGNETFLIDDEDGEGWEKVTEGRGSPHWSHKSLIGKPIDAPPVATRKSGEGAE